jgi:hypothetical protein
VLLVPVLLLLVGLVLLCWLARHLALLPQLLQLLLLWCCLE